MDIAIVTGSAGLIGSEAAKFFYSKGMKIVGIDNDMRRYFFGEEAGTNWNLNRLKLLVKDYVHYNTDIRNSNEINKIFSKYNKDIKVVVHTAAQPSHDWAAKEPMTDFTINANGTLNLLEATRKYCENAVFIFTSTNKVYGDSPNRLPLIELGKRWEVHPDHEFAKYGIDESMSIDQSIHSLFGVSKVSADLLVQEYGKYFDMSTVSFRGGCLTGPAHSGTQLHGFLAYLAKCAVMNKKYIIYGYKGKQVRDNIHSKDLVKAFWEFYLTPRKGEVYNMGGSRHSNVSILEAIELIEDLSDYKVNYTISDKARMGDHIWYVSDVNKFKNHYPEWEYEYDIKHTLAEIINETLKRYKEKL